VIKILVVDDHIVVRRGLELLLTPKYGIEIVGEAINGLDAIEKTEQLLPDVILMDVKMPQMNGIEATERIHNHYPAIKILALTSYSEQDQIARIIKAGALGYILKDSSPEELIEAINQVASGNLFVSKQVANEFVTQLSDDEGKTEKSSLDVYNLTPRETEVFHLLVKGHTNKQIAQELVLSEVTARFHVSNILHKFNVKNRSHLIASAVDKRLIN
jgi:DNA-binding NarL/FixJ family response regulator